MPLFTASRFQNCIPESQNLEASGSETSVTKYVDAAVTPTSQGDFGQRATSITAYDDTANQPINEIATFTLYRAAFYEYGFKVQNPPMPEAGYPLPAEQSTSLSDVSDEGWKYLGNVQGDVADRTFKVTMEDFAPPDSEPGDGTIGGFCWGKEKEDARYYNSLAFTFNRNQGWALDEKYLYGGSEYVADAYYKIKIYVGGSLLQESDFPGPDATTHQKKWNENTLNYPVTVNVKHENIESINNSWPDVQVEIIVNPTGASLISKGKQPPWFAGASPRTQYAVEDVTSSSVTREAWTLTGAGFLTQPLAEVPDANWKCLAPNVGDAAFHIDIATGGHVEIKFELPTIEPRMLWDGIPLPKDVSLSNTSHWSGVYSAPAQWKPTVNFGTGPLTLNWGGQHLTGNMTLDVELKVGGVTILSGSGDASGADWTVDNQFGANLTYWTVPYDTFNTKDATWWYDNANNMTAKFSYSGTRSNGGVQDWRLRSVHADITTSMYSGIAIAKGSGDFTAGMRVKANLNVDTSTVDDTTWLADEKAPLYLMQKTRSEDANDSLYDRDYKPTISGELTNGFPLLQLGDEVGFEGEDDIGMSTGGWLTMGTAHYNSVTGSGGSLYNTRDLIALDTTGIDMSYQVLYDGTFKLIVNTSDEDGMPGTFMQPAGENSWQFTLYWYNTTTLGYGFIDRFWWEAGDSTDGYVSYTLDASATAQIAAVISGNEYQTTDRHVYLQTQAIPDGWGTDDYAGYTPGSLCIPTEVISAETSNTGIELFGNDGQTAADILSDGDPDTYVRIKGKRKLSVMVSGPGIDLPAYNIMTNTRDALQPRSAYSFWSTATGANSKICDAQIKTVSHDDYDIRLRWRYYKDDGSVVGLVNHKTSGIDQDDLPGLFWGTTDGACPEAIWNSSTHAGPSGLTPYHQDNMWLMIKGEENSSLSYYFDVSSAFVFVKPLCVGNINLANTGLSFEPSYGETS